MGRAWGLPKGFGRHPIDIQEPGRGEQREPERDQGSCTRISKLRQVLKNWFCPLNVKFGFLALGTHQGRFNSCFPCFSWQQRGGLPVSSPSGQNAGPEVGWVGGHLVQLHLQQAE